MIKLLVSLLLLILLAAAVTIIMKFQNTRMTKITSKTGIQEGAYVSIGGIRQFVTIRGENTANPVILVLHGGPGGAMSFIGYHWQTGLESDYTLVNWDQRGCGRTYYENLTSKSVTRAAPVSADAAPESAAASNPDAAANPAPLLSKELLLSDLDELVDYLRERFGQEKIIIMGHSWGTILGSQYVLAHPEKSAAYIGVGQAVDMPAAEILAKDTAILRAEAKGDLRYIDKLNALYDITAPAKGTDMKNFIKMRGMTSKYLICKGSMPSWLMIWTGLTSPEMSMRDFRWQMLSMLNVKKYFMLQAPLLQELFDFNIYTESGTRYEVPAFFLSGDGDWITPYPLVRKYAKAVTAPKMDMILIENTGHSPFIDNPPLFCKAVRKVLK